MTQTLALLLDAYRELNAKKMFWISLIISALIMLAIAALGVHERGVSILWFEIDLWEPGELGMSIDQFRPEFYESIFSFVGITVWLTWAAIILAIVSTASMFPDLMSSGSIDTLLSKPIGRFRLFMTKYLLGLGFVALQVLVFSVAGFLVIGIRAGHWEPRIFLAVPIVLAFFSYLYAISTLVGVYTRSTLAAILVTIIVWFGLFAVNYTDTILLQQQASAEVDLEQHQMGLDYAMTLSDAPDEGRGGSERERYLRRWGVDLQPEIDRYTRSSERWSRWRWYIKLVKTPLPKTGETRALLGRALTPSEDIPEYEFDPADGPNQSIGFMGIDGNAEAIALMTEKLQREQRPVWWVVITSLLFEVVVVGLAAWKFCRRDF
ncbi:MAG: ABC transporter permease [Phycisphaerales bacterium JB063]